MGARITRSWNQSLEKGLSSLTREWLSDLACVHRLVFFFLSFCYWHTHIGQEDLSRHEENQLVELSPNSADQWNHHNLFIFFHCNIIIIATYAHQWVNGSINWGTAIFGLLMQLLQKIWCIHMYYDIMKIY